MGTPRLMTHSPSWAHFDRLDVLMLGAGPGCESALRPVAAECEPLALLQVLPHARRHAHHLWIALKAGLQLIRVAQHERGVVCKLADLGDDVPYGDALRRLPLSIATRSACAMIKKSSGEIGQPCATPDLMSNQSL